MNTLRNVITRYTDSKRSPRHNKTKLNQLYGRGITKTSSQNFIQFVCMCMSNICVVFPTNSSNTNRIRSKNNQKWLLASFFVCLWFMFKLYHFLSFFYMLASLHLPIYMQLLFSMNISLAYSEREACFLSPGTHYDLICSCVLQIYIMFGVVH